MNKLPIEIPSIISPTDFLKILLIGICSLFFINLSGVFYLKKFNPNKAYALIAHKWQMIFDTKEKVDWLILGDSSGNQGIDARQFEITNKEKALNLCTIADMLAVNDIWMLEKHIQQHDAPKNILLIHTYDMWHRQNIPEGFVAQIPYAAFNSKLSLHHAAIPNWKKMLMNCVPLNYQRESLARLMQHPRHLFQSSFHCDSNGFESQDVADTAEVLRDSEEHLIFVETHTFKISKNNREALQQMAKIAQKNAINVYIANAPIYENLYQDENFQVYFQKMRTFLHTFCEQQSWNYINENPMTFSIQELQNVDHLTTVAAKKFTSHLINEIYEN